jgi:hypothetical protein
MNARFLPEAKAEVGDAAAWYDDREPGLGDRFLDAVLEAQSDVEQHPDRFPPPRHVRASRALHCRRIRGFPYSMIYEVREHELLVLAVAHGRRKPGYWTKRIAP